MYKAAIIGCGNIAGGYDPQIPSKWSATHAGAYHLCRETTLVAVADTNPDALNDFQKKWNVKKAYLDYSEMLRNEKIDILSICAPTDLHYAIFSFSIDSNVKAIYLEKPLSNDLEKAKKMVTMGAQTIVSVNYFRRWNATLANLVSEIKDKVYGKGILATVHYNKGIFLNGSHFIDLVCWIWGAPLSIKYIRTAVEDSIDPSIDFSLQFENDVAVYFLNVPNLVYNFAQIDILLEKRRITIGQRGQKIYKYPIIRDPHYLQFDIVGDAEEIETKWRNCTTRAVEEIVKAIYSNSKYVSCTLNDGFKVLQICQDVIRQKQEHTRAL